VWDDGFRLDSAYALGVATQIGARTGAIGGDVEGALEDVNVPSYAIDRHGVIRWLNPAARRLVGDARGRQFTSVVAPEQTLEAREVFARKVFGKDGATDKAAVVIGHDGTRVECEISSTPLREDGRIVGVFGLVTHAMPATSTASHPHLTPRQTQILRMLAHGYSTHQIAAELHLAVETVRNHVRRLLRALDAHSRLEAVATARRDGLLAS
jgi:PAS domain S-box-containing protein